ncbi:HD domain-containing protein, partial [Candidatus Sumerlaeota bacterium]|nr:HD domain-containing protein [Candidatus Sumerlaeota bacterium]
DRGRRNLKIRASIGLPPEVVTSTKVRVGQGISGKVAHEKKLVRATRHAHQTVAVRGDSLGLGLYASNSWLSAPLLIAGEIFGVLNLTDKPDRSDFNQEEEQIIQVLVDKAGTKLENQALYEGIYANLIDTLNSLVTTIEAKDPYTRKHSHRVAEYAMTIARHLKISEEEIELIEFASMLHDIGKIGVRDEILTKPGKLTDAEYEAIKAHVTIGEKIVEPLGLTPAERSIIRNHHERFDGKGYPDRLKGEEIPFLTRVVSVADAFDAITSSRPYRKALTADEAVAEFKKLKGLQFDPVAAEAAIEAIACGKLRILAEWPSPPPVETAQAAIAESRGARA